MLLLHKDVVQESRLPSVPVHSLLVSQGISGVSLVLSHLALILSSTVMSMHAAGIRAPSELGPLSSHKDIPFQEGVPLRCIRLFQSPEAQTNLLNMAER